MSQIWAKVRFWTFQETKETSHRIATIGRIINRSLMIAGQDHIWRTIEVRTMKGLHFKTKFKNKWRMNQNHCSLWLKECLSHPWLLLFWTTIKADNNNFFPNKARWNYSHRKDLPIGIEDKAIKAKFFKLKEHKEIQVTHTLEEDRYSVLRDPFQLNFWTHIPIKRWAKYT